METIKISVCDGNVSIESCCSMENQLKSLSVLIASAAINGSYTLDEVIEITKSGAMAVITNNQLTIVATKE